VARESEKDEEHSRELEEKIEDLTRELSGLINAAGTKGRDELRDYAVSLLQGETETTVVEEPPPARETAPSPFNPLALSIPFFSHRRFPSVALSTGRNLSAHIRGNNSAMGRAFRPPVQATLEILITKEVAEWPKRKRPRQKS